jgi:hypothetical protein
MTERGHERVPLFAHDAQSLLTLSQSLFEEPEA